MRIKLIKEPKNVMDYFPRYSSDDKSTDIGNAYIDICSSMDSTTRIVSVKEMMRYHETTATYYRYCLPILKRLGFIEIIKELENEK